MDETVVFADAVLDFFDSGAGPIPGPFGGQFPSTEAVPVSLDVVLGDDTSPVDFLSLPTGSFVTVAFEDAILFDGPGDDLFIEEVGNGREDAEVFISSDGVSFEFLGIAEGDQTTPFDFASIGFTGRVFAVKIVGLDNGGGSPGFDVASVQGLEGSFNLRPVAMNDSASTAPGAPVTIDILANDRDAEDGAPALTAFGDAAGRAPANGTVESVAGGLSYTPEPGFSGIDTFDYEVEDTQGATDTGRVSVRVGSPALPAGVTRGTPGDDGLLISQNSAYVGVGGADSFLFSPAAKANAISLIDGAPGDVLQLTEGLALAGFEIRPDALLLDLETGAQLRLSQASLIGFEVGANPTTEDPGALTDFAGFAEQVLGVAVPAAGSLTGGPLIVEEALIA